MAIERVAILGRGAVGLLYGTIAEKNLGPGAVQYVMDDARYARHAGESVTVNGEPCRVRTVPASEAEPVDLVILAIKAPGLPVALDTMERLVGPHTAIASLVNGVTSEERVAERFGWGRTVLSVGAGHGRRLHRVGHDLQPSRRDSLWRGAGDGPGRGRGRGRPLRPRGPSRTWWRPTSATACGRSSCSTWASTRSAWSLAEPTAPPPSRGASRTAASWPPCARPLPWRAPRAWTWTEADLAQMAALIASLDPDGSPRWRRTASMRSPPRSRSSPAP